MMVRIIRKGVVSMIAESDKYTFCFIVVGVGRGYALCHLLMISWTNRLKSIYMDDSLQPTAYEARLIYQEKSFAYQGPINRKVLYRNNRHYEISPG
jgi:hypothetical protein